MKPQEFIEKSLRTENSEYPYAEVNGVTPRLDHAVMGIVTEAGELMDSIKKAKIYGKTLDRTNVVEEAGDLLWYLALLFDDFNVTFEEVFDKTIAKLEVRYPDKYSHDKALNRNLIEERKTLE